ncbi:MAG: DUF2059 domain-containing protein, partial [Lentisphaerae bacterium]|nr:DUF2059 domain-containing protein [Lentisphaerota bacterium]
MNVKILFARFVALSLFFTLSFTIIADDAQNPAKEKEGKKEKAMKVLKISGSAQTYVEALLEGIKQAPIPYEDKELYSKFATSDGIIDYFLPVYMEKYTEEELDAMIDFYSSPAGQS